MSRRGRRGVRPWPRRHGRSRQNECARPGVLVYTASAAGTHLCSVPVSAVKPRKAASRLRLRSMMSRSTASRRRKASPCRMAGQRQTPERPRSCAPPARGRARCRRTPRTRWRYGDAAHRPAEAQDEQQGERHVEGIGDDQERHRPARVLQTEQPAEQHHIRKARGRTQEADAQISLELLADPRPGLEQPPGRADDAAELQASSTAAISTASSSGRGFPRSLSENWRVKGGRAERGVVDRQA